MRGVSLSATERAGGTPCFLGNATFRKEKTMRMGIVLALLAVTLAGCIHTSPGPTVVTPAPNSTATVVCPNGKTVTAPAVCP